MSDTLNNNEATSGEVSYKRLNRLPQAIAFVLVVLVASVFVYALIQRVNTSNGGGGDAAETAAAEVETASTDELALGAPSAGVIPEAPKPVDTRPVPSTQTVIQGGVPTLRYDTEGRLAGASDSEQEQLAQMRIDNAIEYERYNFEQSMARKRFRDSAEQQAKSSPMNLSMDELSRNNNPQNLANGASSMDITGLGGLTGLLPTAQAGGSLGLSPAQEAQKIAELTAAAGAGAASDPNRQSEKVSFSKSTLEEDYLERSLQSPISPYEVKQGTIIPGLMVTGVNSDLPGAIIGQVSQNVYDTVTGAHLLIPQGTRLFGQYDSSVSYGQKRVLIVWNRMILPNGEAMNIGAMGGSDGAGQAGLKDKVNRHLLSMYGQAVLLSAISGGIEALSGNNENEGELERAIRREFGDNVQQTTSQVLDKELGRQPTLTIRPGKRFVILVNKDMVLEPYSN